MSPPLHAARERTIAKDKNREMARFIKNSFLSITIWSDLFVSLLENLSDLLVRQAFVTALREGTGLCNLFELALFRPQLLQGGGQPHLLDKVRESLDTRQCQLFIGFARFLQTLQIWANPLGRYAGSTPGGALPGQSRGCSWCRPPAGAPCCGTGSRSACPF